MKFVVEDSKYVKLKLKIYVEEFASSGHKFEKRPPGVYRAIAVLFLEHPTIFGTHYWM